MNYGSWTDEELRRALNADPDDIDAIIEAAERYRKASHEEDEEEHIHEFDVPMECPECGHEWDEVVDCADYQA
jgi:hypothetical protein